MGLENEYGISSAKSTDPIVLSNRIVLAYANHIYPETKIRWDYDLENPLRDARGFDLSRAEADISLLTNDEVMIPNLVLPNGARFYVDHAHPEYAAPEVLTPSEIVQWDLAGERIMQIACALDAQQNPDDKIRVFKNNVDNKGASYGTHENYMTTRSIDFNKLINGLTPHFITRQLYCGAGRIGLGQKSERSGYQISQRADYIEAHVGLETTMKRPIINTRDEPHADPAKHRRLHVIIGDANMSDFANLLKVGTTSLILSMIEDDFINSAEVELTDPVQIVKDISQDLDMKNIYETKSGKKLSALNIQYWYLEKAREYCNLKGVDEQTKEILKNWEYALEGLKNNPEILVDKIDWLAKYSIIEKYRNRDNFDLNHPTIRSLDFKYSEITENDGIGQVLRRNGLLTEIITEEAINKAITEPPETTRAWFRGKVLSNFSQSVSAVSWDSVIFDLDKSQPLVRISTLDPLRGTRELVGQFIDKATSAAELVSLIRATPGIN